MKIFKSHFWYSKSQRNGVFILVIIIVVLQVVIFINPFSFDENVNLTSSEFLGFQKQIDSLKVIELENRKPKIYPFNPNYVTDYRGEKLGMSILEIDRLLAFRKTGKFINSKEDFQNVTKVSDSLLNKIAPYFKFPDWVVKQNKINAKKSLNRGSYTGIERESLIQSKYKFSTKDINKATQADFVNIEGIGSTLSDRIIKYRSKLKGFSYESQLNEVWGLDNIVSKRILSKFKILEKPIIKKNNVNTIEFKQLLKNPYIDYELCKKIFEYRDEVAELQDISELKNIKDFPLEKYDRIVLYLLAE